LGYGYYKKLTENLKNPIVTMDVEGFGIVKIELYPDKAPNTVANFIKLINEGFYDGLTFHRTIPDFMIQGGDKEGTGSGELDYAIPGEFIANGFKANNLKHERGVLSMARGDYSSLGSGLTSYSYNSAGSQFFIMTKTTSSLDGYYAAFGRVIDGMDVVDAIEKVDVVSRTSGDAGLDKPINPPVIKSMTVDTFGVNYGEPETVEPFDYNTWLMQTYGFDLSSISE
jgi:peptidyl-prolyl cis-trans isomerase B (cyclophilin B)